MVEKRNAYSILLDELEERGTLGDLCLHVCIILK
jgi:hypothetical protein